MRPTVLFALLLSGIVSSGAGYEPMYHNSSHQDDGIIPQDTSLSLYSDFRIGDTKKSCFIRLSFLKNGDDFLATDWFDSLVTAHLDGEVFQAGKVKKALFGKNYRQEWIIPVTVPVFDLENEKGGLKVLKRGGGDQTASLRLQDRNGRPGLHPPHGAHQYQSAPWPPRSRARRMRARSRRLPACRQ